MEDLETGISGFRSCSAAFFQVPLDPGGFVNKFFGIAAFPGSQTGLIPKQILSVRAEPPRNFPETVAGDCVAFFSVLMFEWMTFLTTLRGV